VRLVSAKVGPFRSINTEQAVAIDPKVTVLVGMNEAGKTVLLKALYRSCDALGREKFDPIEDYPRKDLASYLKRHGTSPDSATTLTYEPTAEEIAEVNAACHTALASGFQFSVGHKYDNVKTIQLKVSEAEPVAHLAATAELSTDAIATLKKAQTIRSAADSLAAMSLTEADGVFLKRLQERIKRVPKNWDSVALYEVWEQLDRRIPQFLYFSDYDILPGKMNLADLARRVDSATREPSNADKQLLPRHQAVLALLRMADVGLAELAGESGYETMKAKIEAVSINLTDQVLEFWKQNEDLEVEVDIKSDSTEAAPFNEGPNLYLRIKNRRHRGVSTPFDQRSRGFIWFFSFLVWFDSVQHHLDPSGKKRGGSLILLLDEPGLALHALAQADFLRYIDTLSEQHQVLYTTHSPFMVNPERLSLVRVVEDREKVGTVISESLSGTDDRTIFPLQAALGWTIAQNLFITKRNVLVEGPSELVILQATSALLESSGRAGLRDDATIVPVGGIGNVVTFVSLLGANGLKVAVLHDYAGNPDQKLQDLVRQKLLAQKSVFNVSQFRDLQKLGQSTTVSDIEDLFEPAEYLEYFNAAFSKQLGGVVITEADLPKGSRVVARIEQALAARGLKLRPSGGFNHYTVASVFGTTQPRTLSGATLDRFSALFEALNKVL